jgi:polygalacturonase
MNLKRCALLILFTLGCSARLIAKDLEISVKPELPKIPNHEFKLTDFGGVGDGKTWNTDAFTKAIAAVEQAGGGKLIVPKGIFRTKPFVVCSALDLHLDDGAVILAAEEFSDLDLPDPATLSSQDEVKAKFKAPKPLISGVKLHDLAITGTGIIDGAGSNFWKWSEKAARKEPGRLIVPRPRMIVIEGCERMLIEDITLKNSPSFHLVPRFVNELTLRRIKVRTPADAPNTDAIDPTNCVNALITECDIDTGDDNIVLKQGGSNILIENCVNKHGHGISIGSGTQDGLHDVLVRHCTFDGTDNGIRIKSMRGAGGLVENIRFTDIQMKNVKHAIVLDLTYMDNNRPDFKGDGKKIPKMQHIQIDNVKIEKSKNAGRIVGLPESKIEDVLLRDVSIEAENDFVQADAERITFENVERKIGK